MTLQKISTVLDAQGFQINNVFYIRELSFANDFNAKTFNVDPEVNILNIGKLTRGCIDFQTNELHGLKLRPEKNFHLKHSNINSFLPILIESLTNKDKPYVAIKNQQLATIFKSLNIDFVNLEKGDYLVPSLKNLDQASSNGIWMCSLHTVFSVDNKRCALRKGLLLWSWLKKKNDEEREMSLAISI